VHFSFEDFEAGKFKPSAHLAGLVIYRGWMLTPDGYHLLHNCIQDALGVPFTNPLEYQNCHWLPCWYKSCEEFTPKTIILDRNDSLVDLPSWSKFFVKDYVKSLTTERGSIASNVDEIREVISLIEHFRGDIEGGICIREFEDFDIETEDRYFVLNGVPYSREGVYPSLLGEIAHRVNSRFYSVDLVKNRQGLYRLVELGDGQVSDRKKWTPSQFFNMFKRLSTLY
jgi:hypothetical protein